MTLEEARNYLNSYKDYANRMEYIENKVLNVRSTDFQAVKTSNTYHKNQNDYIEMKDHCLKEMAKIRGDIDRLSTSKHREILFYKYCELMNVYEIGELMGYSHATVYRYIGEATKEFAKAMTEQERI